MQSSSRRASAIVLATSFLISVLASTRPSNAGPPTEQAPKIEIPNAPKVATDQSEKKALVTNPAPPPPPPPPQPMPMMAVNRVVDVEGLTESFTKQLRHVLAAELRLITSVSEPSPSQRKEIAIEGVRMLKQVSRKVAEVRLKLNQGQAEVFPDARQMIREATKAAAKARLAPEQFAKYKAELESRDKDLKETLAFNLVAKFDRLLFLSAEQRVKLRDAFLGDLDPGILPSLEDLTAYEAYYPPIPDPTIMPILTDGQVRIWQSAQKIRFDSMRNYNFPSALLVIGADEDEDIDAALAVEVKK